MAQPLQRTLPSPGSLRRLSFGLSDAAVFLGLLGLLALLARVGAGAFVAFTPPHVLPQVSLDPRNLPYYAGRSTLRMFIALGASFVFTYVYGAWDASSARSAR